MGQEIVYCFKCSSRIVSADLDRGEAVLIGNRTCCGLCLPSVLSELPEAERDAALGRLSKTRIESVRPISRRTPRGGTPVPSTSTPRGGTPTPGSGGGSGNRMPLVLGAAVLALGVIVALISGGRKPAAPVAPPPAKADPPRRPDVAPREEAAREALEKARDAARSGIDIDLQVRLWEEAVAKSNGSAEAVRERDAVLLRRKEVYAQELARLMDSVDGVVRQEEYKQAGDALASARKRHDHAEWTQPIDLKLKEIRKAEADGAPFRQADGGDNLVCIEAEHLHAKADRMGHAWTPVAAPPGYGGSGAMAILPNKGTGSLKDFAVSSPRMDYRIRFERAGKHYLWIRGRGDTGTDDSIHVGLDGKDAKSSTGVSIPISATWGWMSRIMSGGAGWIDVPSPGLHVLNIWMREDGAVVDRFVLTTNAKFVPKGVGPPESPR